MLTISTIEEALGWLSTATGRTWTQAEFFDLATSQHIDLHAVAPESSQTALQKFVLGEGLVEEFRLPEGSSLWALLRPFNVGELWQRGETKTLLPPDYEQGDDQWKFFTAPVTVTADMVRVKAEALRKVHRAWEQAQSGKLAKHRGPAWLFTEAVKLAEKKGREVPAPASAAAQADPSRVDSGSIFRDMQNLDASELKLAFVGEKSESGLGANNMLEVSARGITRRIPLAALDLVDKGKGTPNGECGVLLGLAKGSKIPKSGANSSKMSRLRKVFKNHFGTSKDPFEPRVATTGWVPLFEITDKRGVADARAQKEAERRTVSLDQMAESGRELSDPSGDDADDWMRKKGHSY